MKEIKIKAGEVEIKIKMSRDNATFRQTVYLCSMCEDKRSVYIPFARSEITALTPSKNVMTCLLDWGMDLNEADNAIKIIREKIKEFSTEDIEGIDGTYSPQELFEQLSEKVETAINEPDGKIKSDDNLIYVPLETLKGMTKAFADSGYTHDIILRELKLEGYLKADKNHNTLLKSQQGEKKRCYAIRRKELFENLGKRSA